MNHWIRKTLFAICLLPLHATGGSSVGSEDAQAPLHNPIATPFGLLYASSDGTELRLRTGSTEKVVVSGIGSGLYPTLSPDRRLIGLKLINEAGLQIPTVVNLQTGELTELWSPSAQAGQVSFTSGSRCAFTVGENLILSDGKTSSQYLLGSYANLAPISPDARYVAYNDKNDQLWLLDLATGGRATITDSRSGYWYPLWSPDGSKLLYMGLDEKIFVFEIGTQRTVAIGEGNSPAWSPDSRFIVFSRKVVRGGELVNSDLYLAQSDEKATMQLTDTDSLLEAEASFLPDGSALLYRSHRGPEIYQAEISVKFMRLAPPRIVATIEASTNRNPTSVNSRPVRLNPASTSQLNIPYINQVYDTPDWFNGDAACGPTSAMMVLAYYNVLPRWDVRCSWPSPGHVSPWGRYICDRYYFRQRDYASSADDPSGHPGAGGYGFMWSSSSPHSTMESYFVFHGLSAALSDSPPLSTASAEINSAFPYTICVGLTTAGHIVVAHGLGSTQGTIIVHDPYGNKNLRPTSGYPNYYGRNVPYDWPGYNNGYENLNSVYWAVSVRGTVPVPADTLVDDMQLDVGFHLQSSAPATMTRWKDLTRGYGNHLWYTYTKAANQDTCYGTWTPNLPSEGRYEVFAYISVSNATAARYVIIHRDGTDTVAIDQKAIKDSWVPLGTYDFLQGTAGYVRLGDASDVGGQEIVFDALRWSIQSPPSSAVARTGGIPTEIQLSQNYPNPFNPSTQIAFTLGSESNVRLSVYNILGEQVEILTQGRVASGKHTVEWSGQDNASGVYISVLEVRPRGGGPLLRATRKMLLIR